jgi:hypothetical protein
MSDAAPSDTFTAAEFDARLADYHKASPELAHWLARWHSDDVKT